MIQTTNNIKISVLTDFEGVYIKNNQFFYAFKYQITIENNSTATVQLISRHWEILDSLKPIQIVDGEGVIGKKPKLNPGDSHTYASGCILSSTIGAMSGYFNFINHNSTNNFKVQVPTFKLLAPYILN
jgi:ApaG protein